MGMQLQARTSQRKSAASRRAPIPPAARDALLNQHVGLVHHVARQLARRLSTQADLDELVSAGMLGLVQAVDSFDAHRGLSFSTFAVPRIRGAILDELRKQDSVPRNVRRRTRDMGRARDILSHTLRREPTEHEVARVMAIPAETLRRWEVDAEGAIAQSLDQPVHSDTSAATLGDTLSDERDFSIDDLLSREQEVEILKNAIASLREQERNVLALNFYEELKLQEIAKVLGLSVCRISQIRTAALRKLRGRLNDLRVA
jgi:RNA polymerase sigma factor for flagellar operon FliA